MKIENYLQNKLEEYGEDNVNRMIELYENVPNIRLKKIFSKIHFELNGLFRFLNEKIPRKVSSIDERDSIGHYNAVQSRELIYWINQIDELQSDFKGTEFQFEVHSHYKKVIEHCDAFLESSGGSPIPSGTEKVSLISVEPIFIISNSIKVSRKDVVSTFIKKLIGEGSYANVFKYKDEFYDRYFVMKQAKSDLTDKEYERFKREFEDMKSLNSPYIVDVFSFNNEELYYVMEFMDDTLHNYIMKNNNKLTFNNRKAIVTQILRAFEYIHSKGRLHRDISLTNVLLKLYEDIFVVKVSDFGLVKIEDSQLTSMFTEFKGSLNDPNLELCGFEKYNIKHETYALTRLIYFVLTGRTKIEKFDNAQQKEFVLKGISNNVDDRYENVQELRQAFWKIH